LGLGEKRGKRGKRREKLTDLTVRDTDQFGPCNHVLKALALGYFILMADSEIKYLPITSKETLANCKGLHLEGHRTLFICSYPKSGTTWVQAIVYSIISGCDETFSHISDYAPFFEIDKTWSEGNVHPNIEANFSKYGWRIFNTHLRWEGMPKCDDVCSKTDVGAKYIYVYRDGKDVCTSFFKHLSAQADAGHYQGDFLQFVKDWCRGEIVFGGWLPHLRSWFNAEVGTDSSSKSRIHFVRYEDLVTDLPGCIRRITRFLGYNLPDKVVDKVESQTTFEAMRNNIAKFQPVSVPWRHGFSFIRQGKPGAHDFGSTENALFETMLRSQFPTLFLPRGEVDVDRIYLHILKERAEKHEARKDVQLFYL
jgi:hypothetical protein